MKEIAFVTGVEKFYLVNEMLVTVRNNIVRQWDGVGNTLVHTYEFPERMEFLCHNENAIWINSKSGKGYLLNNGLATENGNYILYAESTRIIIELSDDWIQKKDRMNGTVKWKEQPLTLLYHTAGKNFYTRGAYNEVICRDWETGEIKWTRSFSGIYDYIQQFPSPHTIKSTVTRFLCETDGVLWIALSSGRLLGLNENSGEEVYNISNPANFPAGYQLRKEDEYLHYGLYMNFDKNSNMFFGLRGNYYFEIGLNDPVHNYSIYDIKQELHTVGFDEINFSGDGYQQAWFKNEIYFGQQDRQGPTIGIFERESKHITWVSGLPASNSYLPNIRKIGYAGNKLYALDGNQVLHIYSR